MNQQQSEQGRLPEIKAVAAAMATVGAARPWASTEPLWWNDSNINQVLNAGVVAGYLYRPSTTQVEWTEAGIKALEVARDAERKLSDHDGAAVQQLGNAPNAADSESTSTNTPSDVVVLVQRKLPDTAFGNWDLCGGRYPRFESSDAAEKFASAAREAGDVNARVTSLSSVMMTSDHSPVVVNVRPETIEALKKLPEEREGLRFAKAHDRSSNP